MLFKYITFIKKRNLSQKTVVEYLRTLQNVLDIENNTFSKIKKIIVDDKYSANTQLFLKNVYSNYLKWNKEYKKVEELKFLKIKHKDVIYRHVITMKTLYKKTEIKPEDSLETIKLKYFIKFLFETGIRVSEFECLIYDKNKLIVNKGKGNKKRQIFYKVDTLKKVIELFPNFKYGRTIKTFRIQLKKLLGKHYSPHSLRRSFATHMLTNGANPKMVMLQMGHTNIETTFSYLHLSERSNKKIYDKFMKEK